MASILIIDGNGNRREELERELETRGHETAAVGDIVRLSLAIEGFDADVVLVGELGDGLPPAQVALSLRHYGTSPSVRVLRLPDLAAADAAAWVDRRLPLTVPRRSTPRRTHTGEVALLSA